MSKTQGRGEYLLESKARFHKIYQERIASADGRQEAMENDLADFDKGIELLLQGQCHRVCKNEVQRFATVYGWIFQKSLPLSFRDYYTTTGLKKINRRSLLESPSFAYLVGAYQAKTKDIHPQTLTIGTGDSSLEHEVEKCFHRLHMIPGKKEIFYKGSKSNQRIYYCSSDFMSCISEITENNTIVPHSFFIPNLMNAHLSGFSDARAVPSHAQVKSRCSSIVRKYPIIIIIKKGNVPLLSAVNSAFHFLGVASVYDPHKNSGRICIAETKSIKKFIDLGLFRSRKKMGRIRELYDYWRDTNEIDRNGAYDKLKKQVLLERVQEDAFVEDGQDEDDFDDDN